MSTRILIIAHAPLANALRDCALHVFPECTSAVIAVDVPAHEAPEDTLNAAQLLLQADPLQDTLVLTDVLGATPANVAQKLVAELKSRLVACQSLRQTHQNGRQFSVRSLVVPRGAACECQKHHGRDDAGRR